LVDCAASTVSGLSDENSIKRSIEKVRTKAGTKKTEKVYKNGEAPKRRKHTEKPIDYYFEPDTRTLEEYIASI
jgi:hypothetical protein